MVIEANKAATNFQNWVRQHISDSVEEGMMNREKSSKCLTKRVRFHWITRHPSWGGQGGNAPGRKDVKEEKRRGSVLFLEGVRLGLYSSVGRW